MLQKAGIIAAGDSEPTDAVADSASSVDDEGLTEAQCTALQNTMKAIYGDAQYCQSMYEIDVFGVKKTEPSFLSYIDKLQALEKEFVVYDQNQFVDDQAFKALWQNTKLISKSITTCEQA
jgi:hypothetical protein